MTDILLAFLIFLGSATAIPLAEPLRIADLAFLVAAALCAKGAFRQQYPPGSPMIKVINTLLVIMAVAVASWMIQLVFGTDQLIEGGLATGVQIPGAIICALLIGVRLADENVIQRCGQISFVLSGMLLVLLLAYFFLPQPDFLIIDYTTTNRFSALSSNPNQLGLVLVPLPFFSYIAAKYGTKPAWLAGVEISIIITVNYFSFGKTLFVAWMFFFAPVVFLDLIRQGPVLRLLLIPTMIAVFPLVVYRSTELLYGFYTGEGTRGSIEGQGEGRLSLWVNGVRAWVEAPIIGHGPGPLSGATAPFQGTEAHNTIVDWMASFGTIGAATLLALYLLAFRTAWARRNLLMIGLVLAIATQAFTQFYGRAPFYWLWWILSVALATRAMTAGQAIAAPDHRVGRFALA